MATNHMGVVTRSQWQSTLETAQKTALLQDGRRKIHYTFDDGTEMVEEYDASSNELLLRKTKERGTFGNAKPWAVEVGEVQTSIMLQKDIGIIENSSNPVITRRDKLDIYQWRIRNLKYPIDLYSLSIEGKEIVVRTTNKKYFKRIGIPDLNRLDIELDERSLTYAHANNTLIITYKKPSAVLEFEKRLVNKLKALKSDGDVDHCKQQ